MSAENDPKTTQDLLKGKGNNSVHAINTAFLKSKGIELKPTGAYGTPYNFNSEDLYIGQTEWGNLSIVNKKTNEGRSLNIHTEVMNEYHLFMISSEKVNEAVALLREVKYWIDMGNHIDPDIEKKINEFFDNENQSE